VAVPLVLASRSPQLCAILTQLGVEFEAIPADIEELAAGDPAELALENARRKARAVARRLEGRDAIVLGVDTDVELDGRVLGKAPDARAAWDMLRALSGRSHTVHSGLWVIDRDGERGAQAATDVRFRALSDAEVDSYVAAGEWRDRAGAYAIQGRGAALVDAIAGDYFNVVGLPVAALAELLPDLVLPAA
jgi:septum formation protein